MEIIKIKENDGFMVRVDTVEALSIIKSLTTQMLAKSPNHDRLESTTNMGYFSISVQPDNQNCDICRAKMMDDQIKATQKIIEETQKIVRRKENAHRGRTKEMA